MDLSYDSEMKRQCFKCPLPVLNSLNLFYVPTNASIILWNMFQVFIYENLEFETPIKTITPEFQIKHLIISNNYLLSLDYSGNMHIMSLKFKSVLHKIKFCFLPKEQAIISFTLFTDNLLLSLKSELGSYYLYLHRIGTEFSLEKKLLLLPVNEVLPFPNKDKCLIKYYHITEEEINTLQTGFVKKVCTSKDTKLIILSIDKLNIFYCFLNSKLAEHEINLNKLYTCPSEISDIEITRSEQTYILIGLTIGTLIKIDLQDLKTPSIIHLNTAISEFKAFNNTILYSDGISLWKSEIKNEDDLKFRQCFVKQVKDFIKINEQIVCTTYMNMIYTFSIHDDRSYLKSELDSEYCPAEKLFSNYEYLTKIMEEIKKNEGIIKKLSKQKDYITALALSNRQDIMENVIDQTVLVFENYNDAVSEHPDLNLTNDYSDYFDSNSIFFLVNITTSDNKLTNILSSSLGDLKIHITFSSDKVFKTISIKVTEKLNKNCLLIPLKENLLNTELHIKIKIMTSIPGAYDLEKKIWAILYRKTVILKSEHFIKTNVSRAVCLKEPETTLSEQIILATHKLYGNLFDFTDLLKTKPLPKEWNMYVRLPDNYQDALKNSDLMKTHLNKQKTKYLSKQLTSDEFLRSKNSIIRTINTEKVRLEVENDGFSNPVVKVVSSNLKVALNIREFLSDLYYKDKLIQGREFVHHSFYITVENLQKAIRDCLTNSSQEALPLVEQFERNVMGMIPV